MGAKADLVDIVADTEAGPGAEVSVKTTVRNVGDALSYVGLSAWYWDGATWRDSSVTPTRVRLGPGASASFTITFDMPSRDTEIRLEAWHGDGQNRVTDDSRTISLKLSAAVRRTQLISELVPILAKQGDFLQQQRKLLRAFRQSTKARVQAEAEASSLRWKKAEDADDKLNWIRTIATEAREKAEQALNDAKSALATLELESMLDQAKSTVPSKPRTLQLDKANEELVRWSLRAAQAASGITTAALGIRNWRQAQRERGRLTISLVLLLLSCLGFVFFLAGVITESVGLLYLGLIPPPLLLAFADTLWNLGEKEPGQSFSMGYLGLWSVAPVAPFVALYWIFASYPASIVAINKRYKPMQPEHIAIPQVRWTLVPNLVQALAEVLSYYNSVLEQAQQEYERSLRQIDVDYQRRVSEARSNYEKSWQQLHEQSVVFHQTLGLIGAPWDDPLWDSWTPTTEDVVPPYLRVGHLVDQGRWNRLAIPALVPVIGRGNVIAKCSGAAKDQAVQVIRGLMLRMLAMVPPGKLRFTLIDPVGLGQSMASFMRLADYDEALVGGKIWTEPQHIEEQLSRLTEHMEFVIQKFLRDKYPTIEDYNTEAGEVAEPYRVLVVINFPFNFTESAARRLVSIALNGPRCGVYTIVSIDTEQQLPYGFREGGGQPRPKKMSSVRRRHKEKYGQEYEDDYRDEEDNNEYYVED